MTTERESFEGWAVLELMGHRKLGGYLREQEIAGAGFLRIDIPGVPGEHGAPDVPGATQFYAPSAVYGITPTTEEVARGLGRRYFPEPVQRWELPPPRRETIVADVSPDPYDVYDDEDLEDDGE